jgi:hypothetical protein
MNNELDSATGSRNTIAGDGIGRSPRAPDAGRRPGTAGTGDATLLGAVGAEDIPDDVTSWGLLIPVRRAFDQYVNLRPVPICPA